MPSPLPEPATAVPAPGLGRIAAGITLFHPTAAQVAALPGRLPDGLGARLAFANSALDPAARGALEDAGFVILGDGANLGIAEALNRLAAAAAAAGAEGLYLLDQDAAADPALPGALLAARARLRARGLAPAAVGPAPAAAAGHKAPAYPARPGAEAVAGLRPVQFLATSGTLLDLAAFAKTGPFRADFFIDGVELEWCFRAWSRGHGSYLDPSVSLPHRVGGGTIRAFGIAMPRQPLFRMATYLRNSVYAWRLPHLPLSWKLAQGLYLPAQAALYWADSGCRPAVLGRLAGAARDGLLGRLGPPGDLP
ncbi:glycosyltransferase family 2 protein [Methylobacterium sp. J-076]|uniref:glycosyltransferase family 2 protein n=1 Tax=Methylobacterium sp. J-076 TaxID=2836655 RepID=UPI001FBA78C9|nr:glycosyltransferase family 2 protein [Methylobacterium sp. J-076]MCJ2012586.1 rhamnosyltransferase [Methylobacterium sp. J-076]